MCVCVGGGGGEGDNYNEVQVTVLVEKKSEVLHTLRSVPNLTNEFPVTQKVNKKYLSQLMLLHASSLSSLT